jgi:hypothetical protein
MKSYIPKQPKQVRERIEAKLDVRLVERLQRYCQYLESDRDYVVAQALELIFRKDRGFADWLAEQRTASPDTTAASGPGITNRRVRKEATPAAPATSPVSQTPPMDLSASARRA